MAIKSAQERIAEIQAHAAAEIAKLTQEALTELQDKRLAAAAVLKGIEDAIEELLGKPARSRRGGGGASKAQGRSVTPAELKKALKDGESNTRKLAKILNTTNSEVIAAAKGNPDAFKLTVKAPHYFVEAK
jgi:hypothetical protein